MEVVGDWSSTLRILVFGPALYLGLVILLRISGNRTLSKMNAFDLIVTVALGSALSSGILQKSAPLSDVLLTFIVLVSLQFIVTWLSVRFRRFEKTVKSEPIQLVSDGSCEMNEMKRSRVTPEEIQAAMRENGFKDLKEVEAIYLETNGKLSVVPRT